MKKESLQLAKNKKISAIAGTVLIVLLAVFLFSIIFSVTNLMSRLDDIRTHPLRCWMPEGTFKMMLTMYVSALNS